MSDTNPQLAPVSVSADPKIPIQYDNPFDWKDVVMYLVAAFILGEILFPLIVITIFTLVGYANHTLHNYAQVQELLLNPSATFSLWIQFALDLGLILPVLLLLRLRHRA